MSPSPASIGFFFCVRVEVNVTSIVFELIKIVVVEPPNNILIFVINLVGSDFPQMNNIIE